MYNGMPSKDGSYMHLLVGVQITDKQLRSQPQKRCPVCCKHLARDQEMILIRWKGSQFWACRSEWEGDDSCGFAYRNKTRADYVACLVVERGQYLKDRHRGIVAEKE